MNDKIKALKSFNQFKQNKDYTLPDFDLLLKLEHYYYTCLLKNGNFDIGTFMHIVHEVPNSLLSKGYILDYIILIANKLNIDPAFVSKCLQDKNNNYSQIPIHLLLFILNDKNEFNAIQSIQDKLINFFDGYLNKVKFPTANQSNDITLINCQFSLQLFFQKFHHQEKNKLSKDWYRIIVAFLGKTFQDIEISKTAMIYFMVIGNTKESILNFNNLLKYSQKDMQLNGGNTETVADCNNISKFNDSISLIDSFCFILNNLSSQKTIKNLSNFFQLESIINDFMQLLQMFYQYNHFKLFNDTNHDSLNFISNHVKIVLPDQICKILTNSWQILFNLKKNELLSLQQNQLTSFLCNAMTLMMSKNSNLNQNIQLKELFFEYAFTLAQMRQIDNSIEFLENQILNRDPLFYKAWHLLALCKSVQEDKQDSYKIVCSVLESMVNDSKITTEEDKWQLLSLKITQIYLINEIFGTRDSIEIIPDLFVLYHDLYDASDEKTDVDTTNLVHFYSRNKLFILQTIWLLTAELYMELYDQERQICTSGSDQKGLKELLKEAKNAIRECGKIKVSFKNINYHIVNSYLYLLQDDTPSSMDELEKALSYDDMNVDAIVAMAQLIHPSAKDEKDIESYLPLLPTTTKTDKRIKSIFANETDQSAAYARLKLLLESSIIKTIDAYYSADIWWFLAQMYEKYQDKEYPDSLLTCIKNRETTPIRAFEVCHY